MMTSQLAGLLFDKMNGKEFAGYRIQEMLGSGGSAVVVGGTKEGREYAVKIYAADLATKHVQKNLARLERQRELIGHDHPNIVKVYEATTCRETGQLYVVMEKLPPPNLAEALLDVPRDRIRHIIGQVAQAAFYLHSRGIVHRDIKPANIAVDRTSFDIRLLDLGIVRPTTGETATDDGSSEGFLGTMRYSPPEFINGAADKEQPDTWQAITFYQLGAVLHDLIMRRIMFEGVAKENNALYDAVLKQTPLVAAEDVPQDLVLLAKDCLRKNPESRLRFVRWQRFIPAVQNPDPEEVIADQFRELSERTQVARTMPRQEQMAARQREVAYTISNRALESAIRTACVDSRVFPPLELVPFGGPGSDASGFWAKFEFPAASGDAWTVALRIDMVIVEVENLAIEVVLGVFLWKHAPTASPVHDRPVVAFAGTFDQGALADSIIRAIPRAIVAATRRLDQFAVTIPAEGVVAVEMPTEATQ